MKFMGDTKSAFEYANNKMREYQVGDFIRFSQITDWEFLRTEEYVARIIKIQFGEIGFWGTTSSPSFVVERIDDGKILDLISIHKAEIVQNSLAGGREASASVYPFAEYYVDSWGGWNNRIKTGHWGPPRGVEIAKLDNVEIKNILINAKRAKEEKMGRDMEESNRKRKEEEERKRANDVISKEELDALLRDLHNT